MAHEIAGITSALLGPSLSIETMLTTEIEAPAPDTFYICAVTQEDRLRRVLPAAQLYVFDLHPTTRFFLDIAKIPAGETVYVFNNLDPYTELLIKECHELGINALHFRPLAFEEMPLPALLDELEQARWPPRLSKRRSACSPSPARLRASRAYSSALRSRPSNSRLAIRQHQMQTRSPTAR